MKKRHEYVKQSNIDNNILKYLDQGKFYIPYAVVSSKNSRRIVTVNNKRMLLPSKQYELYHTLSRTYYLRLKKYFLEYTRHFPKPLHLGFHHIRFSKERWDYHNMTQGPADIMQECGWIEDDNCDSICVHPDGYTIDRENQGLIITPYESALLIPPRLNYDETQET